MKRKQKQKKGWSIYLYILLTRGKEWKMRKKKKKKGDHFEREAQEWLAFTFCAYSHAGLVSVLLI